jgi:hypothetical protein
VCIDIGKSGTKFFGHLLWGHLRHVFKSLQWCYRTQTIFRFFWADWKSILTVIMYVCFKSSTTHIILHLPISKQDVWPWICKVDNQKWHQEYHNPKWQGKNLMTPWRFKEHPDCEFPPYRLSPCWILSRWPVIV